MKIEEIEQELLGMMIYNNDIIADTIDKLQTSDFSSPFCQRIYTGILSLIQKQQPIELITLYQETQLDAVLIGRLVDSIVTTRSYKHRVENIIDHAKKRKLSDLCKETLERIQDKGIKGSDLLYEFISKTMSMMEQEQSGIKSMREVIKKTSAELEKVYNNKNTINGLSTGLNDLDELIRGLKPSKLYVIAARPGSGKTALVKNLTSGATSLIFSVEMGETELGRRYISDYANISMDRVEAAQFEDKHWSKLMKACGELFELPIWIDDSPSITDMQIWSKAKTHKLKFPDLSLVVVDYIQIVRPSLKGRRSEQIESIARNFKAMAKDLNVSVVCLAQLNRDCEKENRPPKLSDLREGGIEADADVVLFLYPATSKDKKVLDDAKDFKIAKNRSGPVGRGRLSWDGKYTRFEDYM